MDTPLIETPRLTLRPYTLDDVDPYLAMLGDPQVYGFLGGRAMSAEDGWNRLLRYAGHWAVFGFGMFAVFERDGGRFVGEVGVADFHRGLGPDFDGVGEAAWVFSAAAQGRGYAAEAMAAALDWYVATTGRERTVCLIAPDNGASLRLADRLGYTVFGETEYRDGRFLMLERL